ncbi:MAG TPA: MogA/MoaB family molybdenum cofactor biosynthesis protein, partial [Solirubrobacteraceae bacterium]|nr:MogA/MoaB family molybdenum cofactor biosynthesis protein [Solirubrobacteraceae bacterium]
MSVPPAARVAILTVSTSRAAGAGADESGEALEAFARELGGEVIAREIVSDDQALIEERLRRYCDEDRCALVLTTGGTGVAPRDVTPEATAAVLERPVPGIAEAMRLASREHTKHWMLSRATAGVRGRTLIVNFPGNPRSIAQTAAALAAALPHALSLLADAPTE